MQLLSFKILLLLLSTSMSAQPQTIANYEVNANKTDKRDIFVNANIEKLEAGKDQKYQLYEVISNKEKKVPFQLSNIDGWKIWWEIEGTLHIDQPRYYELRTADNAKTTNKASMRKNDKSYILFNGNRPVLHYNHAKADLPPETDPAYSRSGFIHPLFTPSGKILTMIQPPDHIHHYGLWNAWTRTVFNHQQIDFWNLGQKQGKVNYTGTISATQGPIFQSLRTLHHHVLYNDEEEALNEELEIRVFHTNRNLNIIDYTSTYNCAHKNGLLLEQYRYGGFVFRGNENWNGNTVEMLTSEGRRQDNSDGERARWCLINEKGTTPSGILILSHPENRNHPEPLRTWDSQANNGRANIFINFSPIRNMPWQMNYGENYKMRYRIITFDGRLTKEQAEQEWSKFANPPRIKEL